MSLLSNLKSTISTATKKLTGLLSPTKVNAGGGGSWGPTTTQTQTQKPATWGLVVDTSYKMPNTSVGNTTPAYSKTQIDKKNIAQTTPAMTPAPKNIAAPSAGGGKSGGGAGGGGGSSRNKSTSSIDTSTMSLASPNYDYGLGASSASAPASTTPTSATTPSSNKSINTGSSSNGGGGGGGVNSGSTPADQLAAIKAEAERLQGEVSKLYGQETTAAKDAVSSDTEVINYEKEALKKLKEAGLMPDDSALKMLEEEKRLNEKLLRQQEANIKGAYDVQKTGMEGKQLGETGQLSAQIANAGGYLGFSGSGTGVMLKLAESHRAELNALESQRQNALQEARNAAAERRFDIVRLKADEIARIDQEKYNRVQEYNTEVKKQAAADLERAKTIKREQDIMGAINTGAKTPKEIFNKLGGAASMAEIGDFLEGMTSAGSASFKFSADETASLLGSGMGQDDIQTLMDVVAQNGYTEEIRAQLTPLERAAADKIFRAKTGDTSSTSFVTENGVAISDTAMQVIEGFTQLKNLTPTARQKVQNELYELGFNSENPPSWFDVGAVGDMIGEPVTLEMLQEYYKFSSAPGYEQENLVKFTKQFVKEAWTRYRANVMSEDKTSGTGGSLDSLSYEDV